MLILWIVVSDISDMFLIAYLQAAAMCEYLLCVMFGVVAGVVYLVQFLGSHEAVELGVR